MVIHGINDVGFESGNETMCDGVDLAWLQNTAAEDAWNLWSVEYRDVVIVDREGYRQHSVNVTDHDLSDAATYQALSDILRDVAAR